MNPREIERIGKLAFGADVVAIIFAVVANVIALSGELTNLFVGYGALHGGVKFVYASLCYPAYHYLGPFIGGYALDHFGTYIVFECFVVISAILYRWILYLVLRIIDYIWT